MYWSVLAAAAGMALLALAALAAPAVPGMGRVDEKGSPA